MFDKAKANTMKKIMFHINALGRGGAERVVTLLSGCFAKEGVDVVIATEWQEENEYELPEQVRRIHVGLTQMQEQASRLMKQWYRMANLRKAIRQENPDLVISFCVKANYRAMMATTGLKTPVIVSVRNDPKIDYVGKKNQLVNKLFLNKADGCVFQTEEAKEFFDPVLQKKSAIICNPVNEKYLQATRQVPAKKIVTVGRLVQQKNQMLLVKAFESLLQSYPDYDLYLYGDGALDECKEQLHQYVKETSVQTINRQKEKNETLDVKSDGENRAYVERQKEGMPLSDKVHFMGLSSTLEKDLADAAMFVLPSNYEGMPNALMEAMALGLPVISTDCPCGGSRYWITHMETGQLTPVGDEKALTDAMVFYIDHPEEAEAIGKKARARLQEATLEKVFEQWKDYIQKTL